MSWPLLRWPCKSFAAEHVVCSAPVILLPGNLAFCAYNFLLEFGDIGLQFGNAERIERRRY